MDSKIIIAIVVSLVVIISITLYMIYYQFKKDTNSVINVVRNIFYTTNKVEINADDEESKNNSI